MKAMATYFMTYLENFKIEFDLFERFFGISVPNYQVLWTASFARVSATKQDAKKTARKSFIAGSAVNTSSERTGIMPILSIWKRQYPGL